MTTKTKGFELLYPLWKKRLGAIFGRRPTTIWSRLEMSAFDAIIPLDENELFLIERYYGTERKKPVNYCRRELLTLLNNWPGEVDKAREWSKRRPVKRPAQVAVKRGDTSLLVDAPARSGDDFKRAGDVARAELARFKSRYGKTGAVERARPGEKTPLPTGFAEWAEKAHPLPRWNSWTEVPSRIREEWLRSLRVGTAE